METRTELILLQRTMVVVEGVARSLDPSMNMWETARPVVSQYIADNLGPKAVARDLAVALQILTRIGPRLPQLAEMALIRANADRSPRSSAPAHPPRWRYVLGGAAAGALLVILGAML